MSRKRTLLLSLAILLVAAAVVAVIFSTEPEAKRGGATKETAMLVEVTSPERGTFRPTIEAMGTVVPARDVVLSPRVAGEVVALSEAFTPGGTVPRGEVLLRIDPADYENALARRRSELRQAVADLELEMGRQDIARQDYALLEGTVTLDDESLVLREPQLETARALVDSARAAVERAELDLARTTLRAPFDAHVLRRGVNLGSQVAPGDDLGRLVGLDVYWVEAAVPMSKLRFVAVPAGEEEAGAPVRLRDRAAWPEGVHRSGHVVQLLGELAEETRMARVLVAVPDPLGQRTPGAPPLMIGAYVEATIEAEALPDVVRLDRDLLRGDDTVWVMEDGRLRIREVDVVFRDARYAYVERGVAADDRVVVTNLSTVVDGARLRLAGDGDDGAATEATEATAGGSE